MDNINKEKEGKKRYRKYFERDRSLSIQLTKRDYQIIKLVYTHRFLSSEQIFSVVEGSQRGILRRLNLLFHTGYLDRPIAQLQLKQLQRIPLIYGLGKLGAEFIAKEYDINIAKIDWTSKNHSVRGMYLEHTLMTANFVLAVQLACHKVKGVSFISEDEIIDKRPLIVEDGLHGLKWSVEIPTQLGSGCKKKFKTFVIPDTAFGLRFHEEDTGKIKTVFFFVELDRSTMPIKRSNFNSSSYFKKMISYFESWKNKDFEKNFGFTNPRVLSLTISKERALSMVAVNKEIDPRGKGLRMFMFATAKSFPLDKPESVFEKKWLNGCGENSSLLD